MSILQVKKNSAAFQLIKFFQFLVKSWLMIQFYLQQTQTLS